MSSYLHNINREGSRKLISDFCFYSAELADGILEGSHFPEYIY